MQSSRKFDIGLAAAIATVVPIVVLRVGDPLYIGIWYYLLVPAATVSLGAILRAKPPFISGASFAVAITFLAYMSVNWRAARPEGLLALGHLFSLPGAGIGLMFGAFLSTRSWSSVSALLLGIGGLLGGFLINQVVVCNTIMWCGPMSWPR